MPLLSRGPKNSQHIVDTMKSLGSNNTWVGIRTAMNRGAFDFVTKPRASTLASIASRTPLPGCCAGAPQTTIPDDGRAAPDGAAPNST